MNKKGARTSALLLRVHGELDRAHGHQILAVAHHSVRHDVRMLLGLPLERRGRGVCIL